MLRRFILVLLFVGPFLRAAERPGLVFVTVDGFGWGDLGMAGNAQVATPHLDKLFNQSAVFRDFHVSPLDAPSRAALITGLYPERAGVWGCHSGRNRLKGGVLTLARHWQSGGGPTGLFGTWALGDVFPSRPRDHGYGESLIHPGGLPGNAADFYSNDGTDDYWLANGDISQRSGSTLSATFASALRFIERNAAVGFLCHIAPSLPAGMPPEAVQKFTGRPDVPNPVRSAWIAELDEWIGELTDRLDRLKISDRTIVVFTSTSGMHAPAKPGGKTGFNAGRRGTRGSPYDGGHCVPLAVRWPGGGVRSGSHVVTAMHADLLPTIAELADLPLPPDCTPDGISLAPVLKADLATVPLPERIIVTEAQEIPVPMPWRQSCVISGPWRLVNGRELYDVRNDPGQRRDVSGANREVSDKLRAAGDAWWQSVNPAALEPVRMVAGGAQDPVVLTPFDWNGRSTVPFTRDEVINGRAASGTWALHIAAAGSYDILLRRWPLTVDHPVREKFFAPDKARIRIGTLDETKPVPPDATGFNFRVTLPAGPANLQAWFSGEGKTSSAYFVEIRRAVEIRAAKPVPNP